MDGCRREGGKQRRKCRRNKIARDKWMIAQLSSWLEAHD